MIVPNADRTHAYQVDEGWGSAVELFEVVRLDDYSGGYALFIVKAVGRTILFRSADFDECRRQLEHLCRLSGWRPIPATLRLSGASDA